MVDVNTLPYVLAVAVLAGLAALVLLSMFAESRHDRRQRYAAGKHAISPLVRASGELPSATLDKNVVPEL